MKIYIAVYDPHPNMNPMGSANAMDTMGGPGSHAGSNYGNPMDGLPDLGPGPHMDLSFQNQMHQGKQLTEFYRIFPEVYFVKSTWLLLLLSTFCTGCSFA